MNVKRLVHILLITAIILANFTEASTSSKRRRKKYQSNYSSVNHQSAHQSNKQISNNRNKNNNHSSESNKQYDHSVEKRHHFPSNSNNHQTNPTQNQPKENTNAYAQHENHHRNFKSEEFVEGFAEGYRAALRLSRRLYGTSTTTTTKTPAPTTTTSTTTTTTTTTNPCINNGKGNDQIPEQMQQKPEIECQTINTTTLPSAVDSSTNISPSASTQQQSPCKNNEKECVQNQLQEKQAAYCNTESLSIKCLTILLQSIDRLTTPVPPVNNLTSSVSAS